MENLDSVKCGEGGVSHWTARAPGCKLTQWDAEIINEHEDRMIAWRSLPGSDPANAGSVWFEPTSDGKATRVKVTFEYVPSAGKLSAAIARFIGADPAQQVANDLQRLKVLFESGNAGASRTIPTGQVPATGESPVVL
jgi:uncharacterized membrane protein